MKILDKIVVKIENYVCIVTFIIMIFLTFANVVSRFLLHMSLSFTEEIVTGLFVIAPCRSIGCSQEPIPPGAGLLYRLHAGKGEESAFCRGNGAGDHPVRNDVLLWGADGASGDVS